MKKGLVWAGAALLAAVLIWGGVSLHRMYYDRKSPNFKGPIELYVYPGTEPEAVLDTLLASGRVRNPRSLRRSLRHEGGLDSMQVGHYRIDSTCSSMFVARMLTRGWQTPVNLTLSGAIRSPRTLARKVGSQMLCDSSAVASFIYCPDSLRLYGVDTTTLFSLVIPDTYQMKWTASVGEIFERFRKEHNAYWNAERLEKAQKQGLTPLQVSTLASIVDGETRYVPEQPTIAAVYLNRYRIGMKLQADPTIAYCYGYTLNRILRKHLDVDSPYNTYKYAGLPPGPISCPPKSCLEAVLNPDTHSYLYFCADPSFNGSHLFATTYSEHLENARAFQRALTERLKNK